MDTSEPAPRAIDRNVLLLSVFLVLAVAALFTVRPWRRSQVAWGSDLEAALGAAKVQNRFVFVEVYANWCPPCRQIERDTFSDAAVGQELSALSPVQLSYDIPAQHAQAAKWGHIALPEHVLLRPDGTVRAITAGYLTPDELLGWLHRNLERK